jgi:hypothetical protein
MKIKVKLEAYAELDEAIENAVEQQQLETERENEREFMRIMAIAKKWFQLGDYVTLEIDTENQIISVLEAPK